MLIEIFRNLLNIEIRMWFIISNLHDLHKYIYLSQYFRIFNNNKVDERHQYRVLSDCIGPKE